MQVTTIEARFMRRVQLRDYEPAEAEIKLTASLAEGEDFENQHEELMQLAKNGVRTALIGRTTTGKDASAAEVESGEKAASTAATSGTAAAVAEIAGKKRGRKSNAELAEIEAKLKAEEAAKNGKPNISNNPEDRRDPANPEDEIPGDEIPGNEPAKQSAKPADKPAPKADANSEIPGDEPAKPADKPAPKGGITAPELQKWVSQQMGAKKLTAPEVLELIKSKGKDRMAELDPADLVWLKDQLEAKIAAASL